ncbi:DUF4166 domain-containing protein [Hyphomicrobium sp. D-2]|uniref:DUF4166 domain-containing protein n=1 Tax=Hyphomicrobium sp. D-2 TaxID=3041621 RepID=UPI00245477C1|nr:DUF4166 domain-containing protein [Hyphomicrobium sp. D-2]MDH4983698.1 DUF4166 domain-containing protein [Hyphomicrobium sp. D-2]
MQRIVGSEAQPQMPKSALLHGVPLPVPMAMMPVVASRAGLPPDGAAPAVLPTPPVDDEAAAPVGDPRFRQLVGDAAWSELPAAVRRRFSKRLGADETAIYRGQVLSTRLSRTGRVLAWMARLIGAPLPLVDGATGPAAVVVSENPLLGGQTWLRIYNRPGRFPQAIHSAKRFQGPTGLEEYVGSGIGMTLRVTVEDRALVFRSADYFLEAGRWRFTMPKFLQPGRMCIVHRDRGDGSFDFGLQLCHPLLGRLVAQDAVFRDV